MITTRRTRTLMAIAAAALVAACGGKSDADFVADAKKQIESNEARSATISLKSALQKNPQSGEARYLLGKVLLDAGDPVAAGVELQKAADLKFDPSRVIPALARSLVDQGEFRKVLDTYEKAMLPDPSGMADLKTSVAMSQARTGATEAAGKTLEEAFKAMPNYTPALLLQARLLADAKDRAGAQNILTRLLSVDPKNVEAWKLKGDIALYAEKDRKTALEAYRKAIAGKPTLAGAHAAVIEILVADQDLPAATAQVAELKKVLPNHPQTMYFEGVLAYLNKDWATARDRGSKLVELAPNNALALQLAGTAELQLRNLQKAETYLSKAVQQGPGLTLARTMLAQIHLRTGQPAKALETLAPMLNSPAVTPEMLAIAAEAHLQAGDSKQSEELFARATKMRPDDGKIRTAQAMGHLRQGKGDKAMGELEAIAASDKGVAANLALISAHLRKNELDAALKQIDALEKKQPDRPLATNLRGRVLVLKKDLAGGRKAFERALELDKRYYPALASLAALDLTEGKPADAKQRFDAYLKEDPKHVGALMGLAAVMSRTGASNAEVAQVIDRAVKAEPSQPGPRLRLIEHQLSVRDHKAALAAAQDGLAAMPNHPDLLQALGRVQLAMGDSQQAVTTLNKLVAVKTDSPQAHVALGEALLQRKEYAEAEKNFRRALALKSDLLSAQQLLVGTLVSDRRAADALTVAKEVQKQRNDGIGQMLEGDVEASRKNWDAAAAAYRASLQRTQTTDVAVRLHGLFVAQGKTGEADRFAAEWEKSRPRDAAFLYYRADLALAQKDYPLAEARYRAVLGVQPSNPLALNNVAWLMVQQKKPGALEQATKAAQILPNQPAVLDTLALAQAFENKVKEAVETQRKAVALAPQDNSLRLNLARLLVQAGDKQAARDELKALEKLGAQFPQQQQVEELLKSVNS